LPSGAKASRGAKPFFSVPSVSITDCKLVSTDFHHATDQTALHQGNLLQVLPRFDNERVFSHHMLTPAVIMAAQGR
jgi:hypothetical protein